MALSITVNISDTDEAILRNDILDPERWARDAVRGKINNCKKRMLREWRQRLSQDATVDTIPAADNTLIDFILTRPDYKNRQARGD